MFKPKQRNLPIYQETRHSKFIQKNARYIILGLVATLAAGIVWAAFADKGKVLGGSFTVASADIKLLEALGGGTDSTNLKDELPGPVFAGLYSGWTKDYAIKIYNKGSVNLTITSNANYETANDPEDLRSYVYVEPLEWNDSNSNGEIEPTELGTSLGKKTIIKWKTEGYSFGELAPGGIKSMVLRFSAAGITDTKQGKTGIFDFEFNSIQL